MVINKNKIFILTERGYIDIEVFSPEIIRIKHLKNKKIKGRESLSVILQPENIKPDFNETKNEIIISTEKIKVIVNKKNFLIKFYDRKDKLLLEEEQYDLKADIISNEKCFNVIQQFKRNKNEALYGLGQYEEGIMNYKNCEILMVQANRVIVIPFLVSTNNYGILWDNYSETKFKTYDNFFSFSSEVADCIDYYFIYGEGIDEIIKNYRKLTGDAPLFPKWTFGFWQSKERYLDQDELIYIIKECRKRKIPIDAIVQDWRYWGENEVFSGMIWEKHRFYNPKKMMKEIHKLNCHLMASIWPAFGPESKIHKELAEKKLLFNYPHWTGGRVYDAFSDEARKIYWKYVKKCLFDIGVDAYWMDGTEVEFVSAESRFIFAETYKANKKNKLGTMARYLNAFSLMTTKGVYENHRKATDKKRAVILTRSSFAGQQRYSAASWSGDTFAGWETLKNQVIAGINFSTAGVPYWTSDVGAFYPFFKYKNPLDDENYKELYLRWFQFVTFTPILRVHGTAVPRELWRFGEKENIYYNTQLKFINLRYRLLPYIYSTAWYVTKNGYSFIRPLAAEFPYDKKIKNIGTQYFFGPSIMVCPVTKPFFSETKNKGDYIYYQNLFTPNGKEHGLICEYYEGLDFKNLKQRRRIDTSSMGWAGDIPLNIKCEYSERWYGKILSKEAGIYEFAAITDGSLRLWFDGKLVIDEIKNREEKRFIFSVKLKANTMYDIKLEHQQFKAKQAIMRLNWFTPEMRKEEKEKSMNIYFPDGTCWYDFWTGKKIKGGQTLKIKPALDIMPLYIKEGSIIPFGPFKQYIQEKSENPLELRIYTGADASFEIYEDENDNYDYEKERYSIIPIRWFEKEKMLIIGKRQGYFPGMLKERKINVVIVNGHTVTGEKEVKIPNKIIRYSGDEIRIK